MRNLIFFLLLLSGLLLGCQPTDTEEEATEASAVAPFSIADTLQTYLPNWTAYYVTQLENFDPYRYQLVDSLKKDTLYTRRYDPDQLKNLLDLYQDYLMYSPDGSRVLDLYSYRYVFEEQEDAPTQVMRDVDVEAALVNLEEKVRKRLLFLGASGFVEDGAWMNNKRIVITGGMIAPQNPELMQLKIWIMDLETRRLYTYDYPELVDRSKVNYVEEAIFQNLIMM